MPVFTFIRKVIYAAVPFKTIKSSSAIVILDDAPFSWMRYTVSAFPSGFTIPEIFSEDMPLNAETPSLVCISYVVEVLKRSLFVTPVAFSATLVSIVGILCESATE